MLSRKNLIRILINTGIGAVLIFIFLKLVNINEVIHEIAKVSLLATLPFIFFFALSNALRALRLKLLLKDFKIPLKNMILLTYLAQILSFTIPLRMGEIGKGVYLSTQYKLPLSKSLVWILLDRFLDFWQVLVLALLLLIFIPTQLPENMKPILLFAVTGITIATALVIYAPKLTLRIADLVSYLFIIKPLKKIFLNFTKFMVETVGLLRRNAFEMGALNIITLLALLSDGLGWYVLFIAVFGGGVDFIMIFLGSLLSSLTYLIPAAPGYVGSAEASGVAVFSLGLGLDKILVSATTLINHFITLICILVFGITSWYLLDFDLSLVWKKLRREE